MIEDWEFAESLVFLKRKKETNLSIKIEFIQRLLEFGFLQEALAQYEAESTGELAFQRIRKNTALDFLNELSHKTCSLDIKDIELYDSINFDDYRKVELLLRNRFEKNLFFDLKTSEKYIFAHCVNYIYSGEIDVPDYISEKLILNCIKYGKYSASAKYSALKIIKFYSHKTRSNFFSFSGVRNDLITSINKFLFQFGDPLGRVNANFNYIVKKNTNLNSLLLGEIKPRVAVCISGIFKVSTDQLKTIQEMIVAPLNADVFLHTWDEYQVWAGAARSEGRFWELNFEGLDIEVPSEFKSNSEFRANFPNSSEVMYSDVIKKVDENDIIHKISPKEFVIENANDFLNSHLENQENYKFEGKLNQAFMLYGMHRCFELMNRYELRNNFRYDYVIRVRPDNIIFSSLEFDKLNKINANEVAVNVYSHGIADDMFYAERNTYEKMISIWGRIKMNKGLNIFPQIPNFHPHNFLYLWMLDSGLTARRFEINRTYKQSYKFAKIPNLKKALDKDLLNFLGKDDLVNRNRDFVDFLFSISA